MSLTKATYSMIDAAPANVKDFGATGSGNETAAFTAAVTAAVANKSMAVYIPFQTFTVNNLTDCQGCQILGANTSISGSLANHSGTQNIIVRTIPQSPLNPAPKIPHDVSLKALYRHDPNVYYVFSQRGNGKGLITLLVNNITTPVQSLATGFSDTTHFRPTVVLAANGVYLYQEATSATSGTWTAFPLPGTDAGIPTFTSQGNLNAYLGNDLGGYREYEITPKNGRFNVALRCVSGASTSVQISVNGVLARTVSSDTAVDTIKVFWFYGYDDNEVITVRVTNNDSPKNVRIIGCNFLTLADYDSSTVSTLGWSRNSAEADYFTTTGSSDSVMLDSESGIFGGSFHGGESSITNQFLVDGTAVTLPTLKQFAVGAEIELKSTYTVDWSTVGSASSVDCITYFKANYSGFAMYGSVQGNASAVMQNYYTVMAAYNESFSKVEIPTSVDMTALPDLTEVPLGRASIFKISNPTTKQSSELHMGVEVQDENNYGGPYIWKVVGTYNKVYYGPILGGKRLLGNRGFSCVFTFI